MFTNPRQLLRSWYVFALQLPWLPEWGGARNDFADVAKALANSSRPGTFTADDLARYRDAWRRPGAYHAMVNWYRAALRHPPRKDPAARVRVPTLILWGRRDRFIESSVAEASAALCDSVKLEFIDDATHWVQHEAATRVNARLIDFLR
jgi:pimeloyl-ACP methyl ester carboxylesterase